MSSVCSDGVLKDMSLASKILKDISKVLGLGLGLGTWSLVVALRWKVLQIFKCIHQ